MQAEKKGRIGRLEAIFPWLTCVAGALAFGIWSSGDKIATVVLIGGVAGYFVGRVIVAFLGNLISSISGGKEASKRALGELNRCDGCKALCTSFTHLTKVEGKGFLCPQCRSAQSES